MASFKARIGWKRPGKIVVLFRSYPMRNRKFQKNSKKIQKTKKQHDGFISIQNRENENCRSVPFRSVPTSHVIENSKKIAEELKKTPLWHHFKPKQVGKGREREKIKIIVSFRSSPTLNRKFQKNSIKNFKN